jgi:uncharacterized protein YqgV (UPF0045/DUF77 family)
VAWPHDGLQHDKGSGIQLAKQYRDKGCKFLHHWAQHVEEGLDHETIAAKTSVEAGLSDMLTRMKEGRFKVFSTVSEFFEEMRLYHRKDGKIVKVRDDIISATRYASMSRRWAIVEPNDEAEAPSPARNWRV